MVVDFMMRAVKPKDRHPFTYLLFVIKEVPWSEDCFVAQSTSDQGIHEQFSSGREARQADLSKLYVQVITDAWLSIKGLRDPSKLYCHNKGLWLFSVVGIPGTPQSQQLDIFCRGICVVKYHVASIPLSMIVLLMSTLSSTELAGE